MGKDCVNHVAPFEPGALDSMHWARKHLTMAIEGYNQASDACAKVDALNDVESAIHELGLARSLMMLPDRPKGIVAAWHRFWNRRFESLLTSPTFYAIFYRRITMTRVLVERLEQWHIARNKWWN